MSNQNLLGLSGVMYRAGVTSQLNAVPPHSATRCAFPPSLTGMSVEIVPSVWPGVRSGQVMSPVALATWDATMSRVRLQPA